MVRIIDKMNAHIAKSNDPFFSFEFFPPKTEAGVENLYNRIDRMTTLEPMFIDVTWGAAGSTKDLTMAICEHSHKYFGVDVLMHLTCYKLTVSSLKEILAAAKDAGIRNILAVRGDLAKGAHEWEQIPDGVLHAIDLVKLIRELYGDYFGIAVAGFPEGHPYTTNSELELTYLKEKIDAGADFILTQFFYDVDVFLNYVTKCRSAGIKCPIIPGMMPIQSYSSFEKMTSFCKTYVPSKIWDNLNPIRENDEEVKAYGVTVCVDMCKQLQAAGLPYFHFYTLNLERSVFSILRELGIEETIACRR